MKTYYFYLDLTNQGLKGKSFVRTVTCKDPLEDGLDRFIQDITLDGRYLPIEDDISYKEL